MALAAAGLLGAVLLGAFLSPGGAGAASAGVPLKVAAASLSQNSWQLVWRVGLSTPFSPSELARDGRTLCLLLERTRGGQATGDICITGSARGSRTPRLKDENAAGRGRLLPATVRRSSSRELTARFALAAARIAYRPLRWQVISTLAGHACAPPQPGGRPCFSVFPRKPALLRLHRPVLAGCVPRGPSWVFHGPTHVREIALTFDDGPWYDTPQVLSVLERERVVATFFQIGEQVAQYGGHGIERRMLADGDMIGDHTWNHRDVAGGGAFAAEEIVRAAQTIGGASGGFKPCLFRAPYGAVSSALLRVARGLGFATIQWDIDPRDWARPGVSAIYDNVISHAHDGGIVEMHDGGGDRSETIAALPHLIGTLRREGYRFVTVTQLLGYRLLYR